MYETPEDYYKEIRDFKRDTVLSTIMIYFYLILFCVVCIAIIALYPAALPWKILMVSPMVSGSVVLRSQLHLARQKNLKIIEGLEIELALKYLI